MLLNTIAHTPTAYRKFPPEAEPPRPGGWPTELQFLNPNFLYMRN